jgi:hypothetical protein
VTRGSSQTSLKELNIGLFAWAVYGLAILLVVFPVVEGILGAWPLRFGDLRWRYGFIGLFSRSFTAPLFGVFLALVVGAICQHRVFNKVLAIACFVWVGVALLAMGSFSLDGLHMRATVPAEGTAGFAASMLLAFTRYGIGMVVALLLGVAGWHAVKSPAMGREKEKGGSLLVRAPGIEENCREP